MNNEQRELLVSINDYLGNIINSLPALVKAYRTNDTNKISEFLVPLLDGMQWLNEALVVTSNIHNITMKETTDLYVQLISSIETKNNVSTADLLEFDFIPSFEEWQNLLDNILELN